MKALFVELPAFQRYRQEYLSDEAYRGLQNEMLKAPEAGDVITGTGGLRKVRHGDAKRGKGKSGGLRVSISGGSHGGSSGCSPCTTKTRWMICRPKSGRR